MSEQERLDWEEVFYAYLDCDERIRFDTFNENFSYPAETND